MVCTLTGALQAGTLSRHETPTRLARRDFLSATLSRLARSISLKRGSNHESRITSNEPEVPNASNDRQRARPAAGDAQQPADHAASPARTGGQAPHGDGRARPDLLRTPG